MELYFAPLACSLATRIALYEAGADARFHLTDTKTKRLAEGGDFLAINPLGQVPTLRTDAGELLTENAVVLQYVADQYPAAGLAPPPDAGMPRYRLQQWLAFIATELHKAVFIPLLDRNAPDGAKEFARSKLPARMQHLSNALHGRDHLLDRFSVADGYLTTVLNWAQYARIDVAPWPMVQAYLQRMLARPAVARALAEELALYRADLARRAAA